MTTRPSRDVTLMRTAAVFADRSTCSRAAVGAVISLNGRIITTGYNGAPAGMPHCDHTCDCPESDGGFLSIKVFGHPGQCKANQPCTIAVHAEANAIAFAARHGLCTDGAELHTTVAPCFACAKLIINAGIRRVVYAHDHREMTGVDLLRSVTVDCVQVDYEYQVYYG